MKMHRWFMIVSALGVSSVVGCCTTTCGTHKPLFPNAPWNKNCCTGPTARPGVAALRAGGRWTPPRQVQGPRGTHPACWIEIPDDT